jgi:hypothetical protein
MEGQTMFLVCPAYLDKDGVRRCGLPAEVEVRYTMRSTDGPLESAKIRCPRGHGFNGPIEFLTIHEQPTAAAASVTSASTNNVFAEAALDGTEVPGPDTPGGVRGSRAQAGSLKNFGDALMCRAGRWRAAVT